MKKIQVIIIILLLIVIVGLSVLIGKELSKPSIKQNEAEKNTTVQTKKESEKEEPEKEKEDPEEKGLTEDDIVNMEEVDKTIESYMNTQEYREATLDEKVELMTKKLNDLAENGTDKRNETLIKKESIHAEKDKYSTMISFEYACGALGGVTVQETKLTYSINNELNAHNSKYKERGVYYDTLNQPDAPSFYTIAMGERPTGGDSIEVQSVKIDEDENVVVIVKETLNGPGAELDVITYPICQVTLSHSPKSIIIKNTSGQVFKNVN